MSKRKKPFVSTIVTSILLADFVPPDLDIIVRVLAESRSKKFDRFDLSWYKTKARQGKLKGQNGQRYIIKQPRSKTFSNPDA